MVAAGRRQCGEAIDLGGERVDFRGERSHRLIEHVFDSTRFPDILEQRIPLCTRLFDTFPGRVQPR